MYETVLYHRTHGNNFLDTNKGLSFRNNPRMAKKDEQDQEYLNGFAARLADALAHANIEGSFRRKAEQLNVSKSFVEDMLKARAMPSALNVIKLSLLTGVNSDWLLTGRGEMVQEMLSGTVAISTLPPHLQDAIKAMMKPYAAGAEEDEPGGDKL